MTDNISIFITKIRVFEFFLNGGISLTPVHTSGSIGNHGRLPTDIDGIGKAVFIGRGLSDIF